MPSTKAMDTGAKKSGNSSGSSGGALKKLTITSYDDAACTKKKSGVEAYVAQFNPTSLKHSVTVNFVDVAVQGSVDKVKKFQSIDSGQLNLDLKLDATGVSGALGSKGKAGSRDTVDIVAEIEQFKKVTCTYDGSKHEVPYVSIVWGEGLNFKGRLNSLEIKHVMFNSQGKPLRSELTATFTTSKDLSTQTKLKTNQSPDLTHSRIVQVGDTLPLMCQTIYDSPAYYLQVARFNNLVDFRNLEPGTEIIFPPVV